MFKKLSTLTLALLVALCLAPSVAAQDEPDGPPDGEPVEVVEEVVEEPAEAPATSEALVGLAVFAGALVMAALSNNRLIEALKWLRIIPDGSAARFNTIFAAVVAILPVVFGVFGLQDDLLGAVTVAQPGFDNLLAGLLTLGGMVASIYALTGLTSLAHQAAKRVPGMTTPEGRKRKPNRSASRMGATISPSA